MVYFSGDYHGIFDEVLSRPSAIPSKLGAVPIRRDPAENLGNVMVLEYGSPASLQTLRDHLPEIAAVLVEPVQARHPDLQPKEFLQELLRITEESTPLYFRRGYYRLSLAPRRSAGVVWNQGRPGHLRQSGGWGHAHRNSRWQGNTDGCAGWWHVELW